jgi:hypothetical protein
MSILQLPLLVDLEHKVGELVLAITSCHTIIISGNSLIWCIEKCGYDNLFNVSPVHLHVLLGVGNFTEVTCV